MTEEEMKLNKDQEKDICDYLGVNKEELDACDNDLHSSESMFNAKKSDKDNESS